MEIIKNYNPLDLHNTSNRWIYIAYIAFKMLIIIKIVN